MEAVITIKITISESDLDWIEKRYNQTGVDHIAMLENVIQDALFDDMGIVSKAEITRIGYGEKNETKKQRYPFNLL